MSKAFQIVITKYKWRFKFPSGHLFYSASSFYPNFLNAHCFSFSVCKSLSCLFATLGLKSLYGLKPLCLIPFLFQQLLLLVHIWKNELWMHSEDYGYPNQPRAGVIALLWYSTMPGSWGECGSWCSACGKFVCSYCFLSPSLFYMQTYKWVQLHPKTNTDHKYEVS